MLGVVSLGLSVVVVAVFGGKWSGGDYVGF